MAAPLTRTTPTATAVLAAALDALADRHHDYIDHRRVPRPDVLDGGCDFYYGDVTQCGDAVDEVIWTTPDGEHLHRQTCRGCTTAMTALALSGGSRAGVTVHLGVMPAAVAA